MPKTNKRLTHWTWWLLAIAVLVAWQYRPQDTAQSPAPPVTSYPAPTSTSAPIEFPEPSSQSLPAMRLPAFLPPEARTTIALIQRGGPFPHSQDGSVFGNREGHLPRQPRGWYHEYTVDTPGLSHRGARRIITGGNPPKTWHYTSDHYDSFRDFTPGTASGISP